MATSQMGQIEQSFRRFEQQLARASAQANAFHRALSPDRLTAWGKNLQWTGRQIEYNFTLPLVLAGAAAVKWSNDNERAFTRLVKVYGDLGMAEQQRTRETNALRKAFVSLSNIMGITQSQVLQIAGDWAAAGSSGVALAKATRLTAEAMILGELSAEEASQALIAIAAQYNLTTGTIQETSGALAGQTEEFRNSRLEAKSLADVVAILNVVENQTGVSFQGLVQGFQRSAGFARQAGVDVQHLAAMLAAISPAAGSAAQAGNALKTIFSNFIGPTNNAIEVLRLAGIEFASPNWQNKNAVERLEELSRVTRELTANQKAQLNTYIANRFQLSRFTVLLEAVADQNSFYNKTLEVAYDRQKVAAQYTRELSAVLASQPQKFEILKTRIQNFMAEAILPLIPAITSVMVTITDLTNKFSELDPSTQKAVLFALLFLTLLGPIIRYVGALAILIGIAAKVAQWAGIRFLFFGRSQAAAAGQVTLLSRALNFLSAIATRTVGIISAAFMASWTAVLGPYFAGIRSLIFASFIPAMRAGSLAALAYARSLIGAVVPAISALILSLRRVALQIVFTVGVLSGLRRVILIVFAVTIASYVQVATAAIARWALVSVAALRSVAVVVVGLFARSLQVALARVLTFAAIGGMGFTALAMSALMSMRTVLLAVERAMLGVIISIKLGLGPAVAGAASYLYELVRHWIAWAAHVVTVSTLAMREFLARVGYAMYGAYIHAKTWLLTSFVTTIRAWAVQVIAWTTAVASGFIARIAAMRVATVAFMLTPARWLPAFQAAIARIVILVRGIPAAIVGARVALLAVVSTLPVILAAVGRGLILAFTSPWVLGALAVIGLLVHFREQVGNAFRVMVRGVISAFRALPQSVQNVFMAVIRIIQRAVTAIREWLSEISPFKRHSPSVVDEVRGGTTEIERNYAAMGGSVRGDVENARGALDNFQSATRGARTVMESAERQELRADVVQAAPTAGPAFDQLSASIQSLQATLPGQEAAIKRQEQVVNAWKAALDRASVAVDNAERQLDKLQDTADKARARLDASKDALDAWASMPIIGMKAMSDAIFENQMQTKRLQLEILRLEDAGKGPEQLAQKFQALQGDIVALQGEAGILRQAGAGSDVLGVIYEQIDAMEEQAAAVQQQQSSIGGLQEQLDALNRQGQILDLEQSLKFDPLRRQIEDLMNTTREVSFDEIVQNVKFYTAEVQRNQAAYDAASAAVERQRQVVDSLKATQDSINASYDEQSNNLDALKDSYQETTDLINEMENALEGFARMAREAQDRANDLADDLSAAEESFLAAGLGEYEVPNEGGLQIGREGGLEDQTDLINQLTAQWDEEMKKAFEGMGLWDVFKDMWNDLVAWVDERTGGMATRIGTLIKDNLAGALTGGAIGLAIGGPWGAALGAALGIALQSVDWSKVGDFLSNIFGDTSAGQGVIDTVRSVVEVLGDFFGKIADWATDLWDLFGPDIIKLFDEIGGALSRAFGPIKDVFVRAWEALGPVIDLFGLLWDIAKPIIGLLLLPLLAGFKLLSSVLSNTVGPAIDFIVSAFRLIFTVLFDVIGLVASLLTGDWKKAWEFAKKLVSDIWEGIKGIFGAAIDFVVGLVRGLVEGVINFFKWLWEQLVGGSIVPDIVNGIISFFQLLISIPQWIWDNVLQPIWGFFVKVWDTLLKPIVETIINTVWWYFKLWFAIAQWVWDNVLKPIWNKFSDIWRNWIEPIVGAIAEGVWRAFRGLASVGQWVWDNVLKPVADFFSRMWNENIKGILNTLIRGIATIFNGVASGIWAGVNGGLGALQKLVDGINWVLDKLRLPQINWTLPQFTPPRWTAPQLAMGGKIPVQRVGGGFVTNGARAIVGEGKRGYPEYVIPTDPAYRERARSLHEKAGYALGMATGGRTDEGNYFGLYRQSGKTIGGVEAFDVGGWLKEKTWGAADAVVDGVKSGAGFIRKGAVTAAFAPFLAAFDAAISPLPEEVFGMRIKQGLIDIKNKVYDWAKGDDIDRDYGPNWEKDPPPGFRSWSDFASGGFIDTLQRVMYAPPPGSMVTGDVLGLVQGFFDRLVKFAHATNTRIRVNSGYRDPVEQAILWERYGRDPRRVAPPGKSNHEKGLAADIGPPFGGTPLAVTAGNYGLFFPMSWEPWHIEPIRNWGPGAAAGVGIGAIRPGSPIDIGRQLAAARGWGGGEWDALYKLWMRESNWNPNARNPSSGAHGIPQALPGNKMASHGADWYTNPVTQIRWGLDYIAQRYGSPSGAWAHSERTGWYALGGVLSPRDIFNAAQGALVNPRPGGTLIRVGEAGRAEAITPLPNNVRDNVAGGRELHFHGDLSFPNVRDGNDAREFIRNLESLAG